MASRLIAVGDIHGCSQALDAILESIALTSDDTLVALGDYVDRGPDSKGVISRLIELRKTCQVVAIQGNHEEMMLDVVRHGQPHFRWLQYGGVETLDSYGFIGDLSIIPADHHEFFDSMVDYYEQDDYFFVHANYDPDLPLSDQTIHTLRWLKLSDVTPLPHQNGKRAFIGHTHDQAGEIFDIGHLVCLDTYCYGGGWLTAMDVKTGQTWQANIDGQLKD